MKVSDISHIKALEPSKLPEPSRSAGTERSAADRVSTDGSAQIMAAVARASVGASAGRAERLKTIETAVRLGVYKTDPPRIAQQIIEDAQLAARLQALFKK